MCRMMDRSEAAVCKVDLVHECNKLTCLPQVESLHAGEPAKLAREGLHVGFTSNAV